jgi:hypothetical protein
MIAFSTSVHLGIMFLASTVGITRLVLFHIITHRFVKASAFVSSRVVIAANGGQDLRGWGFSMEIMIINLSFLLLCGVRGSIIFNSKEFVLLEFAGILVVVLGWNYSKAFFSNISSYNGVVTLMSFSSSLLLLIGGSGFSGLDLVSMLAFVVVFTILLNSSSGYVLNK